MKRFAEVTGRKYGLFDYIGAPDAERVIVMTAILARLAMALCLLSLLFALGSCCCVGGSDSDNNGDTDIVNPNQHNEGGGGGV